MDYIVGRGGLACEFETYFGTHKTKFIEIHETDNGEYDCRVFNNRFEKYDDGEEYKPDPSDTFVRNWKQESKENLVYSTESMVHSLRKTLSKSCCTWSPATSYHRVWLW